MSNTSPAIIEPFKRKRQFIQTFIEPNPAVFCPANGFLGGFLIPLNLTIVLGNIPTGLTPDNLTITLTPSVA